MSTDRYEPVVGVSKAEEDVENDAVSEVNSVDGWFVVEPISLKTEEGVRFAVVRREEKEVHERCLKK